MNTQTPSQSVDLSDRHADYLTFFLANQACPERLRQRFSLTSRELIEFLTAPAIRETLESMTRTTQAAMEFLALSARDTAMVHLENVCKSIRSLTDPDSRAINNLRLAATQLGRFAYHAISKPASRQRLRASASTVAPADTAPQPTQPLDPLAAPPPDLPASPAQPTPAMHLAQLAGLPLAARHASRRSAATIAESNAATVASFSPEDRARCQVTLDLINEVNILRDRHPELVNHAFATILSQ